jgi:deazaflavin-dependent oxidoreductase (nitroreductase family)
MSASQVLYGPEHVERYRATDGEEGHDWQGTHTLLLTTTGRSSGEPRTTPLIYGQHGDDYVVVASKGGAPDHPGWYKNLSADPEVEVQVKGDRFKGRARTASPEEKPELWKIMTAEWPDYDEYQTKTDREIPVVVLERA